MPLMLSNLAGSSIKDVM